MPKKNLFVFGVPTFGEGEGGGSSRLGQSIYFFQKSKLKTPFLHFPYTACKHSPVQVKFERCTDLSMFQEGI